MPSSQESDNSLPSPDPVANLWRFGPTPSKAEPNLEEEKGKNISKDRQNVESSKYSDTRGGIEVSSRLSEQVECDNERNLKDQLDISMEIGERVGALNESASFIVSRSSCHYSYKESDEELLLEGAIGNIAAGEQRRREGSDEACHLLDMEEEDISRLEYTEGQETQIGVGKNNGSHESFTREGDVELKETTMHDQSQQLSSSCMDYREDACEQERELDPTYMEVENREELVPEAPQELGKSTPREHLEQLLCAPSQEYGEVNVEKFRRSQTCAALVRSEGDKDSSIAPEGVLHSSPAGQQVDDLGGGGVCEGEQIENCTVTEESLKDASVDLESETERQSAAIGQIATPPTVGEEMFEGGGDRHEYSTPTSGAGTGVKKKVSEVNFEIDLDNMESDYDLECGKTAGEQHFGDTVYSTPGNLDETLPFDETIMDPQAHRRILDVSSSSSYFGNAGVGRSICFNIDKGRCSREGSRSLSTAWSLPMRREGGTRAGTSYTSSLPMNQNYTSSTPQSRNYTSSTPKSINFPRSNSPTRNDSLTRHCNFTTSTPIRQDGSVPEPPERSPQQSQRLPCGPSGDSLQHRRRDELYSTSSAGGVQILQNGLMGGFATPLRPQRQEPSIRSHSVVVSRLSRTDFSLGGTQNHLIGKML